MISLLVIDAFFREELLDKDEAGLDQLVVRHLGWTLVLSHGKISSFYIYN